MEFKTINSQDSSEYIKNQGVSNFAVKPEIDFFSMILSHSNISTEKEFAAELPRPENPVETHSIKVENREDYKTENKNFSEIDEKKFRADKTKERQDIQDKDTQSAKTTKIEEPEGKIKDKNTEIEKSDIEEELEFSENVLVKKALNKEIADLIKSESFFSEISEKDIAGVVESLLASNEVKIAIKTAKEDFSVKGNFKDFKTVLSDNLKKIPNKDIEEIIGLTKKKNPKLALKAEDIKKVLEKVFVQHLTKDKKESAVSKNSNNQRHIVVGEVKVENQAFTNDKIKQVLSEDGGTGKKSFNEKGDSREGFNFGYQKSDFTGKRINDMPEFKGRSPEFRQSLQDIVDRARITVRDNKNGNFNVKLYPKELGSVNVNLTMENGVVTAKFFVDSDEAKNLLYQNMENLKNQLKEAGVEVGEFHVGVKDHREKFLHDNRDDRKKDLFQFPESREFLMAATEYDGNSLVLNSNSINVII